MGNSSPAARDEHQENPLPHPESRKTQKTADPNLVVWDRDDPENPMNWSTAKKVFILTQLAFLALAASLGSSIISPAESDISKEVGVGDEVVALVVSLYIVGFALGPILWAPVSEVWGRRMSMLPAMFCLGMFSIGTAVSKNTASVFVTRFFAGVFGSAPVSNVSAALGDIWPPRVRNNAMMLYAVTVIGEYLEAIIVFSSFGVSLFFLPEVYDPVLLDRKAERLRKETGNQDIYNPHEQIELDVKSIVQKQLARPLQMLCTEPQASAIAVYASFVYALLYLCPEVFPLVFQEHRHWSPVVGSLPFLGLFIGVLSATGIMGVGQSTISARSTPMVGKPCPKLVSTMAVGGVLFTVGLFWFGWAARPGIPWIVPVMATGFVGGGFLIIFGQCVTFLVDTYGKFAASAVAANTILRSMLAAGFPLLSNPMFNTQVGVGPGMSLLGGIATLAIPIPFLFMNEFAADIMTMISFTEPWGFVRNSRDERGILGSWRKGLPLFGFAGRCNSFRKILSIPGIGEKFLPSATDKDGFGYLMNWADKEVSRREEKLGDGLTSDQPDFLQHCLDARMDGKPLSPVQKRAHVTLLIQAGADTTGTALGATLRFLALNPEKLKRAWEEIEAADRAGKLSDPIQYEETREYLPFFCACIKEATRLCPPADNLFGRVVGKAGKVIDGHFLPPGTEITSNAYVVQRDPVLYGPDPEAFRPERWLDSKEKAAEMELHSFVFGIGPRICLGKDVAIIELHKLLPEIIRRFDIELVTPGRFVVAGGVAYFNDFNVKLMAREETA
ncbi:hypothetical protein CLAIMM_13801 [Cladophialophora immunda]|nr:hypothetical protein CLAIMM_13801 [Cladophialophora immunda]